MPTPESKTPCCNWDDEDCPCYVAGYEDGENNAVCDGYCGEYDKGYEEGFEEGKEEGVDMAEIVRVFIQSQGLDPLEGVVVRWDAAERRLICSPSEPPNA